MADNEKSDLQNKKTGKVEELVDKHAPKQPGPGPGQTAGAGATKQKRKYTKRAVQPEQPVFDEEQAAHEADFFLEMIHQLRAGAGVTKKLAFMHVTGFKTGYIGLVKKYGDVAGKWMPEFMFAGSLLLIGYDTFKEMKALKSVDNPVVPDTKGVSDQGAKDTEKVLKTTKKKNK